ncbi:MAG: SIS domain-containing protein [Acidimicrobiia bacterium]
MCGIIAVLQRESRRPAPDVPAIAAELGAAAERLETYAVLAADPTVVLPPVATVVSAANAALNGFPGVTAICADANRGRDVRIAIQRLEVALRELDARLDAAADSMSRAQVEAITTELLPIRDAIWAVRSDRFRTADAVEALAGSDLAPASLAGYYAIQLALSGIDRLEVRGRDSAGIHVMVSGVTVDWSDPEVAGLLEGRVDDPLYLDQSVHIGTAIGFAYKAAAEIGDLGDNTARMRASIAGDALLRNVLQRPGARVTVFGHTRWASVGVISEANAHPVNGACVGQTPEPYVVAALNGDIDNYADIAALEHLQFPTGITTDAKLIPALVAKQLHHDSVADAFRAAVTRFEGSVAIALQAADDPDVLMLALRGSGQGLCVGLTEDCYIVASEPYGLVEVTSQYVRLDGETPANPGEPEHSRGQIVRLHASDAGTLSGIVRTSYDGRALAYTERDVIAAQITTRDINRGDNPHFLLKEIAEAPQSFRKTLRGHLLERDGQLHVVVGDDVLPADLDTKLRSGEVRRVFVIGQGTAAIAGQACARFLETLTERAGIPLAVQALPATELSGFRLADDLSDALVVAISQSGTTTDTNRTVDLARSRGACVVAIVNRRQSDLAERADGVLYTSDGRDIEMSVASTKAFYAQVAAGMLLASALTERMGGATAAADQTVLQSLRSLPDAMDELLRTARPQIARAAQRYAPHRRSWAVVGSGPNFIAAQELRIKCSELCYKAIACDVIEDKKHIDLSSEPMILVCAAGLSGSTADDVAKELAIYRAHKAAPIAIVNAGDDRYRAAVECIEVPVVHPDVAFILSAMAGHLFGYEAALAIDATARPLQQARATIQEHATATVISEAEFAGLSEALSESAATYFSLLRTGAYDCALDAEIAVRVASLFRYATGMLPLDAYQMEFGKVGTPAVVLEDLTAALTRGIEALTRSIDTIKHQAKTVTVGISRADDALLRNRLVREIIATGLSRDGLSYRAMRTLVALDPVVESVLGYTRYRIAGDPATDHAIIEVIDRAGIAAGIPSRVEREPVLRGTKQLVADEREVTVARGRNDGRTVIFVPEVKSGNTVGIALLHVKFKEHVDATTMRSVLLGYRNRYAALKSAVTEVEPGFDEAVLGRLDVASVLTEPVYVLAERWRA